MQWSPPYALIKSLIEPLIEKLKNPCKDCLRNVVDKMENIANILSKNHFSMCP